jgi:hypothetical protein
MLRQLALHGREGIPNNGLPWLCLSLLREQDDGTSFESLAEEVTRGDFGDLDSWRDAEARWLARGIHPVDFESWASGRYFNAKIGERGVCYPQPIVNTPGTRGNLADFLAVMRSIDAVPKKLRLLEVLVAASRRTPPTPAEARLRLTSGRWDKNDIDSIVADIKNSAGEVRATSLPNPLDEAHVSHLSLLRAMCSAALTSKSIVSGNSRSPLQLLSREVGAQPSGLVEEATRIALELPAIPASSSD